MNLRQIVHNSKKNTYKIVLYVKYLLNQTQTRTHSLQNCIVVFFNFSPENQARMLKHQKEKVLSPILEKELAVSCFVAANFATFGTVVFAKCSA